uniref:Uncharacterized protein n=1 Tax=Rhizophora mucronata TaxID=61149 RepID=A0A2P2KY46_RHIMU
MIHDKISHLHIQNSKELQDATVQNLMHKDPLQVFAKTSWTRREARDAKLMQATHFQNFFLHLFSFLSLVFKGL